ncbi:hypothetical protein TruAng_009566 [Truncatella angustata]|nr:hypothetical protein TruAng_009566 [Truncatella angustata]
MDRDSQARPRHASTGESLSPPLSIRSGGSFFGSIIRKESKDVDRKEAPKGSFGLTTLYEPPSVDVPVADLVFVHGLNGGSQSTWTKGDESNFWPKHWLPNDDAFTDVRIHTFGYHSGLGRESILGIRDFSHSLLGALQDAPTMSHRQNVPLILIGHSMGGLVIKQALVLAHQLHEFRSLADRICAMFFLGVPHQGAEIAHTLNRVLSLHGVRPFVHELYPSSSILEAINEHFPYLSKDLRLFSFFEAKPMNYGIGKGLIVERQAAVLNYTNERRIYLDANHRDVARFPSVNDPSYLTIRNTLATLIDSLREQFRIQSQPEGDDDETTSETEKETQKNIIAKFLGVEDAPEDDYMTLDATRLPGSCEWLLQRSTFVEWRETSPSKAFWLRGRPGAGKSVISSAVISSLRWLTRDCCFFFFVRADKNKSSVKSFLKSVAFQMAMLHPEIRQAILEIIPRWGESNLEKDDAIVVWRKLFVAGILKIRLKRPQYWVVDALDEANGGSNMITFLSKAQEYWPLGIFVTSRTSIDAHIGPLGLKMEVISDAMTEEDNTGDISLFLERNFERFPAPTSHARKEMAHRILQNSKGCFLWAQLVVKELVQVRTLAQANQVIDSNPSDMEALYLRITKEMSEQRFNQELVKAILAIQTDINDEIGDMERSISESCGNLVYVDNSRKLQLLHLTVREFLTKENFEFRFKVDKGLGHRRLAMETASVDHKEPVSAMAYSESGSMVAMAGPRNVRVWSVASSSVLHTFRIKSMCIAVSFGDHDSVLWVALRNNVLLCWNVETGYLHTEPINWTADFEVQGSELHTRAPQMGVFCMQMGMLAIVYRGEDLIIWDLDEERVYDIYEKDTGSRLNGSSKEVDGTTSVWDVAFSATPETNLIAAAFSDGDLIVYNMDEGTVGHSIVAAYPQTLCCSHDGRTLACGDSRGNIVLYDFETLKMLYKIQFQGDAVKIRSLAFTPDDLRLIEIRGNQCRIWEPSVLLRQDSDDTSDVVSISTAPLEIEYDVTGACNITAIANAVTLPLVFVGKEDGAVYVYDVARDSQGSRLFVQNMNCAIILLHFDPETDILTCCDSATRVTSRRVFRNLGGDWEISNILLDTRPARKVSQLLSSSNHHRLLLSTIEHDTLWPLDESCEPTYVNRIAGSDNSTASMFSWTNLEQLVTISFDSVDPSVAMSIIPLQHHRFFATVTKGRSSRDAQSAILVWDMNDFSATEPLPTVKPAFDLGTLAVRVEQPIGMISDRFIFLDQDYWVCSIDLSHVRDISSKRSITTGSAPGLRASRRQSEVDATKEPNGAEPVIVRHFFVPYDWISMVTKIHVDILARGEIIFVKRSELVVVRRGLEVSETGPFRSLRGSHQMRRLPTRPPLNIVPGRDRHSM